jgi:hypothetical protein
LNFIIKGLIYGGNAVIDNRCLKESEYEIDDALQGISDKMKEKDLKTKKHLVSQVFSFLAD